MEYEFKPLPEMGFAAATMAVVALLEVLATLDPAAVATDPRAWLVTVGAGVVRAAAGATLHVMLVRRRQPEPFPQVEREAQ